MADQKRGLLGLEKFIGHRRDIKRRPGCGFDALHDARDSIGAEGALRPDLRTGPPG